MLFKKYEHFNNFSIANINYKCVVCTEGEKIRLKSKFVVSYTSTGIKNNNNVVKMWYFLQYDESKSPIFLF